ncbi:aldo/keto reductase [bacterium]|nr:aldo/keto reductase [bacterium]
MLYRRLGRTDLQVSELAFGAARGYEQADFADLVHAIIDAGINLVDTATGYGDSEVALGKALQGHDEVLLETKYCPYDSYRPEATYVGTPEALVASAEESLRRLRRDHLDVLLGHGMRTLDTFDRFMGDGCYDAMVRLRDQGKVRFIGISELSEADGTHQVLQRAVPTGAFDVVMLTLNFLLQTAAESVLPLCRKHGVGTVVMMPLNQASKDSGLVSVPAALECIRRHVAAGNLPAESPYTDPGILDFLQPYSVPEAGLRYVLSHDVSTCAVGMRSLERLQQNLGVVDPPYLDADRKARLQVLFGRIAHQVR